MGGGLNASYMYLFIFYISFSLGLCIFLKVYFCFHILWVCIFFSLFFWSGGWGGHNHLLKKKLGVSIFLLRGGGEVGLMPLFKCIYLFFYISFSLGLRLFLKEYFCFHILCLGFYFFSFLGGSGGWA